MHGMKKLIVAVLLAAAVVVAAAFAAVGRPEAARGDTTTPAARSVTTNGHGVVTTTPDTATITAGVRVESETAADALSRCSAAAAKVIAALKAAGGRDVQTQQVSVEPLTSD